MCAGILCGAGLLGRNAWGNQSLHHAWNATRVFLESTSHNCTWQSGAPATPTLSHRSGNSQNSPQRIARTALLKHRVFFFFFPPAIFYTHDGMQNWICEVQWNTFAWLNLLQVPFDLQPWPWRRVEMKSITTSKKMLSGWWKKKESKIEFLVMLNCKPGTRCRRHLCICQIIGCMSSREWVCIIVHMKDNLHVYICVYTGVRMYAKAWYSLGRGSFRCLIVCVPYLINNM